MGDSASQREVALQDHHYVDFEATETAPSEVDTGTMTGTESVQEQGVQHQPGDQVLGSESDFELPMTLGRFQTLRRKDSFNFCSGTKISSII